MRAHYNRPLTDDQGNLLPEVQVSVYNPGTTTLITPVMYSSDSGSDVLPNPFVSNTGVIDLYLDIPARVRIGVVQGGLPVQYYEDVDVMAAGADSQHTGGGTNSVVVGPTATSAGPASAAYGSAASSGGASSLALGPITNATGDFSVAAGSGATASGVGTVAVGTDTVGGGDASIAIGHEAQTGAASATAIGDSAHAAYANSTAVGAGAVASQAHQVMLGTGSDVVEIPHGSAIIMSDSGGARWRITINTDGSLETDPA